MTISLVLTTSMTSLAGNNIDLFLDKRLPNPANQYCFDGHDLDKIADFKKKCDLLDLNNKTLDKYYQKCVSGSYCEDSLTSDRAIFWSSVIFSFFAGYIVGVDR